MAVPPSPKWLGKGNKQKARECFEWKSQKTKLIQMAILLMAELKQRLFNFFTLTEAIRRQNYINDNVVNCRRRIRGRFSRILGHSHQVKCWSATCFSSTWKPPGAAIYFSLDQLFHLKTQVGVSGTPVTGESPAATCQPGKTVGPHHRWVVLLFVTTWFLKVSKQAKWVMHCFAFEKITFQDDGRARVGVGKTVLKNHLLRPDGRWAVRSIILIALNVSEMNKSNAPEPR